VVISLLILLKSSCVSVVHSNLWSIFNNKLMSFTIFAYLGTNLSPQITQSNLFILGDRKSLKNTFLNFLRFIFESLRFVINFEKHWI
jgi:hypothetical protein